MCVFRFGTEVLMSTLTLKQSVSKVIRTEVETCFLIMKINFSMLLLLLLTVNFVHIKDVQSEGIMSLEPRATLRLSETP